MGKKLRLSKSHAESLSRALNDQSRHALGGGGGHPTGAAAAVVVDVFYSTATPHRVGVRTARAYFPSYHSADRCRATATAAAAAAAGRRAGAGAHGLGLPAVAQPRQPLLVNRTESGAAILAPRAALHTTRRLSALGRRPEAPCRAS